ncbi:hypothetical protein B6J05_28690, partial [Klebsiella quasipneumoniae]
ATVDEGFIVGGPVGDFELLLCHGTVCVVGKMRDLILQLSKSSIYSTKPNQTGNRENRHQECLILLYACIRKDSGKVHYPVPELVLVRLRKENDR